MPRTRTIPRDEMRRPLKRLSLGQRLWRQRPPALAAAAAGLLLAYAAGGLWLSRLPAPEADTPLVTLAVPEQAEIITSSTSRADDARETDTEPADMPSAADGTEEVTGADALEITGGEVADEAGTSPEDLAPDDAMAPERNEAMIIIAPHRPLKPAPIAAVTETTEGGALPRIGADGRTPFEAYSQVTPLAVTHSGMPKITLVLGGMGLNPRLTRKAIDLLPGDVTLGFAPYGEDLQAQVNAARAQGHEILLQLPMEPVGYPGISPGPGTLLSDASPEQNLAALHWLLSRFAGYSGVTNYMGARLLASAAALKPVMAEIETRGLVYLEDASVSLTVSPKLAEDLRLPIRRATTVIDAEPTAPAILAALHRLETEATRNGSAIATGAGLDVTIETVAEWAKTLQEKGILLVPVSAAYKGRAT